MPILNYTTSICSHRRWSHTFPTIWWERTKTSRIVYASTQTHIHTKESEPSETHTITKGDTWYTLRLWIHEKDHRKPLGHIRQHHVWCDMWFMQEKAIISSARPLSDHLSIDHESHFFGHRWCAFQVWRLPTILAGVHPTKEAWKISVGSARWWLGWELQKVA